MGGRNSALMLVFCRKSCSDLAPGTWLGQELGLWYRCFSFLCVMAWCECLSNRVWRLIRLCSLWANFCGATFPPVPVLSSKWRKWTGAMYDIDWSAHLIECAFSNGYFGGL